MTRSVALLGLVALLVAAPSAAANDAIGARALGARASNVLHLREVADRLLARCPRSGLELVSREQIEAQLKAKFGVDEAAYTRISATVFGFDPVEHEQQVAKEVAEILAPLADCADPRLDRVLERLATILQGEFGALEYSVPLEVPLDQLVPGGAAFDRELAGHRAKAKVIAVGTVIEIAELPAEVRVRHLGPYATRGPAIRFDGGWKGTQRRYQELAAFVDVPAKGQRLLFLFDAEGKTLISYDGALAEAVAGVLGPWTWWYDKDGALRRSPSPAQSAPAAPAKP